MSDWLTVTRGEAPLVVTIPHAGIDLAGLENRFVSSWAARRDADWWVDRLYAFAGALGATVVRTDISRSVIDVNRDPSGASLYPGMATTALCPETDFDGAPLYSELGPDRGEIARRRICWFDPYHCAVEAELERLRAAHSRVVLYDAHSIRSRIPRLFAGGLPLFNIGSNGGLSCAHALVEGIASACEGLGETVVDGRFKGGWTTRRYADPANGIHAVQMELAMRGYLQEPERPTCDNWPAPFNAELAEPLILKLQGVLRACLDFAVEEPR